MSGKVTQFEELDCWKAARRTLLLFDIDGTLVFSERRDSRCFAVAYEQLFGRPFPSIDWETYPHVTDTAILGTAIERDFGRRLEPEERDRFEEAYLALLAEKRRLDPAHSQEVPGARAAVLRLLADERFLLGVATGGWQRPARLKLAHVGIPAEALLLEGSDGRHTREDILGAVITRARAVASVSRIVYIGDATWDVRTTRNMGLAFVGIRYQGDRQVLQRAGAGTVLQDYRDEAAFRQALERAQPPEEIEE